ncbi:MAG TPA: Sua5/YciO/YrdC/YwlC family protein, partial [Candidatus Saccharimonadales bacterium]|nr:Sua5/YciO/YrdC/YwlC family protein [Candidatus Saccharimonadales bacterium]
MIVNSKDNHKLIETLQTGGVAVIKTDTLYGLVASANDRAAVARVYELKRRNPSKSLIVLVADTDQLYDRPEQDLSDKWPGP